MGQYVVTMRWYVESDEQIEEELASFNLEDKNEKILDILRHRENGTECCSICPMNLNESSIVLDWKDFYGKKPIYMSVDKIKKSKK
jgi:hypothetical protein